MISEIIRFLEKPVRFDTLNRWLKNNSVKILDVGCGNHSPSKTKKYYPNCKYYGIDKSKYNIDEKDEECLECYYGMDIDKVKNLDKLPNHFFDCIILSHIIEHTKNGESIISNLLNKLKKGGVIYLEFPSSHSVYLPSMKGTLMRGTLNFYDDPSHIRIYILKKLENILKINGCKIIKATIRKSLKRIILLPVYFVGSLLKFKAVKGSVFWDITGFASYILALKEN